MSGASNSTIVITAGLAVVTAASFLLQAENEKKKKAVLSQRQGMLKRQSSNVSRSKRDRVVDDAEEDSKKPPVASIGVPTSNKNTVDDSCPEVLDASFETRACSVASESCDESSSVILEKKSNSDNEWKGMHALVFVVLAWGLSVVLLSMLAQGVSKPISLQEYLPATVLEWIKIVKDEPVVVEQRKWWRQIRH